MKMSQQANPRPHDHQSIVVTTRLPTAAAESTENFAIYGHALTLGGHFNFICMGVYGHRIGKLTHPQTKAGTKTDPFSDYSQ